MSAWQGSSSAANEPSGSNGGSNGRETGASQADESRVKRSSRNARIWAPASSLRAYNKEALDDLESLLTRGLEQLDPMAVIDDVSFILDQLLLRKDVKHWSLGSLVWEIIVPFSNRGQFNLPKAEARPSDRVPPIITADVVDSLRKWPTQVEDEETNYDFAMRCCDHILDTLAYIAGFGQRSVDPDEEDDGEMTECPVPDQGPKVEAELEALDRAKEAANSPKRSPSGGRYYYSPLRSCDWKKLRAILSSKRTGEESPGPSSSGQAKHPISVDGADIQGQRSPSPSSEIGDCTPSDPFEDSSASAMGLDEAESIDPLAAVAHLTEKVDWLHAELRRVAYREVNTRRMMTNLKNRNYCLHKRNTEFAHRVSDLQNRVANNRRMETPSSASMLPPKRGQARDGVGKARAPSPLANRPKRTSLP